MTGRAHEIGALHEDLSRANRGGYRDDRDADKVEELLRILAYYAAPTGSEERVFFDYGIEGVRHTVKPDGSLVKTDQGTAEISGSWPNLIRGNEGFYYPSTDDAKYCGTSRRGRSHWALMI